MDNKPIIISQNNFSGGIQSYPKTSTIANGYYFGYCVDYRTDPQAITLYPGAVKESGAVITDLLLWGSQLPTTLDTYYYGNGGNVYHRDNQGGWSSLHQVPSSHGNGMDYFFADDYLYYTNDTTIGRFGPVSYAAQLIEGWLSGSFNSSIWNRNYSTGLETIATGLVTMTIPASTTTSGNIQTYSNNYSLQNQRIIFKLTPVSTQAAAWECDVFVFTSTRQNNGIVLQVNNNNLLALKIVNSVQTQITSVAYSSTNMAYLAFSEQAGTLYFDYSSDGVAFTNLTTLVNPFGTTNFQVGFGISTSSSALPQEQATFGAITKASRLGTPKFSDDFLSAQGGIPTNTASVVLASASSQYAHAADSASLDIISDLTLESFFKLTSLPAVSSAMTLVGKWDESLNHRSYKMDIFGVSGFFGDGSDGAKTVSTNTTDAPIDSTCTGVAGSQIINATNASFAAGQQVLIIQMQGTGAGNYERSSIQSYTTGTVLLTTQLKNNYNNTGGSTAQIIVMKQYSAVTVNNGVTWTAKAWNGTTGGVLTFLCNGTVTINGTISANAVGFAGAAATAVNTNQGGLQGEGTAGASGTRSISANGNGAGGGSYSGANTPGAGGGGSNGTQGTAGGNGNASGGNPGNSSGTNDLTTMTFGGGGGAGGSGNNSDGGAGGNGGGIIFINGVTVTNAGLLTANGANGANATVGQRSAGGGAGAGGSILIKAQTATLGTSLITVTGGTGGTGNVAGTPTGGSGGVGRIAIDYLTSFTGTTSPTLTSVLDNTLVTTVTMQARLGISNDGTAFEYLTQNIPNLTTGTWNRLSISWTAASSVASFYLNGTLLGTATGTKTAISNNVSLLTVGANNSGAGIGNYFNGELNDMRIFSAALDAGTIFTNNLVHIPTNTANLAAYYYFNSALTDATANANNLTGVNTPTYTTDVPFSSPTTRLDIDQSYTTGGSTYTLPTTLSEASSDTLAFTPAKDPQKSMSFSVDTAGSGNWTLTIHDQQNNLIAQQTILAAKVLASGFMEFIFSAPWRIVIGKTYHAHLTVSTGTSKVVSSSLNNFATADFYTYFGFLVDDAAYHPVIPFLQYMIIGNERYVATWDGAFYTPNKISFPTGWRVRCFGFWREFLAIGVWKGTTITDYTFGRVYFWDGIAPTFSFFIDVPTGQINALWGRDSDLFIVAGYRGDLLDYQGNYYFDTGNSQSNKIRFIPKRSTGDTIEVFPGALNYYRDLIHLGVAGNSNSTTLNRGVYSFGTYDPALPQTLSLDYPISTGNQGSSVSIGLVYPVGNQLVIGWQDGSGFGADIIDFTNNPAPHGRIEGMITDDNVIWHDKSNYEVRADFLPLRSGESIDCAISLDRASYTTSSPDATIGDKFTKLITSQGRAREIQLAVDMYATGSTSPTLLGLSAKHNALTSEQKF